MPVGKKIFWLSLAVGMVYLAFTAYSFRRHFIGGNVDFLQLYAGARLVGTPALYQKHASIAVHYEVAGRHSEGVYFSRLPIYAWVLKPLAALPFFWAFGLFAALNLACFIWFLRVFAVHQPELAMLSWFYPPLYAVLTNGQDLGLFLAAATGGYLLLERKQPFAAGLVWSLCAIKPHLFLLVPLVLLVRRQWRALAGGVAGGAVLLAGSFQVQGARWVADYLAVLRDPELHPGAAVMPNFQSVRVSLFPDAGGWVLWLAAAVVAALLASIAARGAGWRPAFALALPASLLCSWHAYMQDCLPLLLSYAILAPRVLSRGYRLLLLSAIAPVFPFLLLFGSPWSVAMPALLLLILIFSTREKMEAVDSR